MSTPVWLMQRAPINSQLIKSATIQSGNQTISSDDLQENIIRLTQLGSLGDICRAEEENGEKNLYKKSVTQNLHGKRSFSAIYPRGVYGIFYIYWPVYCLPVPSLRSHASRHSSNNCKWGPVQWALGVQ